jgi:hypothetical protein
MRLAAADIAALPLPVAIFDRDGVTLSRSPEWLGIGPGAVTYRLPTTTLVVGGADYDPDVTALTAQLIDEMRAAAETVGGATGQRLEVLAISLAMLAGDTNLYRGTTDDVLEYLTAALATVSLTPVEVTRHTEGSVPDAAITALALKQLIVNARRHDDATRVVLAIEPGPTFVLEWSGDPREHGVTTSRHQADRERWGLGYVRLASDALGAVFLAPAKTTPGRLRAVLALDTAPRLRLPLAAVDRSGRVVRASPAWDEETHAVPGSRVPDEICRLVDQALQCPETIVAAGSLRARSDSTRIWVAIPPQGATDRARDVIRGLAHERDLIETPEPHATVIEGLTGIVALLLGDPPRRFRPVEFDRRYRISCAALRVPPSGTPYRGDPAPDPSIAAYLAARLHARVHQSDGTLRVAMTSATRNDPIVRRLATPAGTISLV